MRLASMIAWCVSIVLLIIALNWSSEAADSDVWGAVGCYLVALVAAICAYVSGYLDRGGE